MTLSEIFVQLPPPAANFLLELLDEAPLPGQPSRDAVFTVAQHLSHRLRVSVLGSEHGSETVLGLIDQLPEAIVSQLFE